MTPAASQDNLARLLDQRLPPDVRALLGTIAAAADQRRLRVYLVGGVVRDLLLGYKTLDLDLAVEGDPPDTSVSGLARALADELHGSAVTHRRFGTAKLTAGALTVDLAMARTERYPRPGALPVVQPGTIHDDLSRRDFTINAIAIALAAPTFGAVIDPLGGRADLDAGLIRVLHEGSFRDDPTRILRALRYQARFGFRLERGTQALLARHVGDLAGISGHRVGGELERALEEPEPERTLQAAQEAGVLQAIHPALAWDSARSGRFARARQHGTASPGVYLALWGYDLDDAAATGLVRRLALPRALAQPLQEARRLRDALPSIAGPGLPPSRVYRALERYSRDAVAACRAATDSPIIDEYLRRRLEEWPDVRPELNGRRLVELGVDEGPDVGTFLKQLQDARLDGLAKSKDDEVALVRRWLRSGRGPG